MEEFDVRKVYMTKITHTHTRIGKDYQAVIPPLNRNGDTKTRPQHLPKPTLQKMNLVNRAENAEYGEDKVVDPPVKKRKINENEETIEKDAKELKEKEDLKK